MDLLWLMQTKGTKESVENWDGVAGGLRAAPHCLCSPSWPGGLPLLPQSAPLPADPCKALPRFCMNPLQFSTNPVLIPGTKGADSFPGQKVLVPGTKGAHSHGTASSPGPRCSQLLGAAAGSWPAFVHCIHPPSRIYGKPPKGCLLGVVRSAFSCSFTVFWRGGNSPWFAAAAGVGDVCVYCIGAPGKLENSSEQLQTLDFARVPELVTGWVA